MAATLAKVAYDLKQYMYSFLPLDEYNQLYLSLKIMPDYELYIKYNKLKKCELFALIMSNPKLYMNVNIIKQVYEPINELYISKLVWVAGNEGYIDLLKYLVFHHGKKCLHLPIRLAWIAQGGYLKIMKYIHEELGIKGTKNSLEFAINAAMCNKDFEMVKYLYREMNAEISPEVLRQATSVHGDDMYVRMNEIKMQKSPKSCIIS